MLHIKSELNIKQALELRAEVREFTRDAKVRLIFENAAVDSMQPATLEMPALYVKSDEKTRGPLFEQGIDDLLKTGLKLVEDFAAKDQKRKFQKNYFHEGNSSDDFLSDEYDDQLGEEYYNEGFF